MLGHAPWTLLSVLTLYSQLWKASFHKALGAPSAHAHSQPLPGHPVPVTQGFLDISCPPALSALVHPPPFAASALSLFQGPSPTPLPTTANRITGNVLSLQDPPGLLPDKHSSHQTRPQAPGGSSLPHPSLWRMGLVRLLQEGEITSVWGSGKVSRRK